MTAAVIVLVFGGVVGVFWLGVHAGLRGDISWGALFQFAFLSVMAAGSMGALGETWGDVQKAAGAMERVGELLDARPGVAMPANPVALPQPPRGEVARGVTFPYPKRPDLPALKVFAAVKPGERVALVPVAQSTASALLRFYDPNRPGAGRWGGPGGRRSKDVRARMALVSGEPAVPARPTTCAWPRWAGDSSPGRRAPPGRRLPGPLPEGLAAGRRPGLRLRRPAPAPGIARALVRRPRSPAADRATSALDAENEHLVQRALDEARATPTWSSPTAWLRPEGRPHRSWTRAAWSRRAPPWLWWPGAGCTRGSRRCSSGGLGQHRAWGGQPGRSLNRDPPAA